MAPFSFFCYWPKLYSDWHCAETESSGLKPTLDWSKFKINIYFRSVEVVKWSACMPLFLRSEFESDCLYFFCKIVAEKNENKTKRCRDWPIFKIILFGVFIFGDCATCSMHNLFYGIKRQTPLLLIDTMCIVVPTLCICILCIVRSAHFEIHRRRRKRGEVIIHYSDQLSTRKRERVR